MKSKRLRLAAVVGLLILAWAYLWARPAATRVTSHLGWWAYQDGLTVSSCDAAVANRRLGLINRGTYVAVRIQGTVRYAKGGWRPRVGMVHLSERFVPSPMAEDRVAEFEITPVVELKADERYAGDPLPFEVQFDHPLRTWRWGTSRYKLRCGPVQAAVQVAHVK